MDYISDLPNELQHYKKCGEPEIGERANLWQAAIGLQQVDGLKTSAYLIETAKENIEGKISIQEVQSRILSYYEAAEQRKNIESSTVEADIVSSRIAEILGEKTFILSLVEYKNIHRRLFQGLLDNAGEFRSYNISKKEWVLNGKSVLYASWQSIPATLEYDFEQEKKYSFTGKSGSEVIHHFAKFTSGIWQIHPFCEGNTRATAVFVEKYMKSLGLEVDNTTFQDHSWYFRNALVRANYNDILQGVHATTEFLEKFFSNLVLGTTNKLENRKIHIEYGQ